MTPCPNHRELIAELALGKMNTPAERELRAHLETCPGCRHYLQEISAVTGLLKAVEIRSDIQTSASFHRRVVGAVRAEATGSRWRRPFALIRESLTNWRVALALAGATAAIVAWSASWLNFGGAPDHTGSATFDPPAQAGLTLRMKGDVDPTAANYQRVASHSLEKLDELFASQGNRNPPSAPVFTAAMVARGSLPD